MLTRSTAFLAAIAGTALAALHPPPQPTRQPETSPVPALATIDAAATDPAGAGHFTPARARHGAVRLDHGRASPAVSDVACSLRVDRVEGATVLTAYAVSRDAVREGTFRLVADRASAGGTASVRQGDSFVLRPGIKTQLGEVALGDAEVGLTARMVLTWQGGSTSCQAGM